MTTPSAPETATAPALTATEQVQIHAAADTLQRRWRGTLNVETIERLMTESLETLLAQARVTTWLPVLVERLTEDRLRALVRLESDRTHLNPSVLFLCVHNAGRSQMAAGWMRHLAGDRVDVFSGGSLPAEQLNAAAVATMAEAGIDIAASCRSRGPMRSCAPPTSSSPWAAATPARCTPASATSTGSSTTRPGGRSRRCAPSATRSSAGCAP